MNANVGCSHSIVDFSSQCWMGLVFHMESKSGSVEVGYHYIRDTFNNNEIIDPYEKLKKQLANLFTKTVGHGQVAFICLKLVLYNNLQREGKC